MLDVEICLTPHGHGCDDEHKPFFLNTAGHSALVVFDLYHTTLSYPNMVPDRYNEIWDIYILERLATLGINHRNYTGNEELISRFQSDLDGWKENFSGSGEIPAYIADKIVDYCRSLIEIVKGKGAWHHYVVIEVPFALSLSRLTRHGVFIDRRKADLFLSFAPTARNKFVNQLRRAGLDSTADEDLKQWLIDSGRVELQQLADSGQYLNYKANVSLDPVFEIFKRLDKLKRGHKLVQCINLGRQDLYPSYRTMGTDTARCTCRKPNVMAIPKELRPLVIPHSASWGIVEIDYCQMEVGVIAALAMDRQLISDFNSGDVYQRLASFLSIERDLAKKVFLSLIYGVGISTLTRWIGGGDNTTTKQMMNRFFTRYPKLQDYLNELVQQGREHGFATTVTGLRRYIGTERAGILSPERLRDWETNWFKNYPVQGSSAAVFKQSIINIERRVSVREFRLLVPMYDSIVFEAPLNQLQYFIELVSNEMRSAMQQYFPVLKPKVEVNDFAVQYWNSKDSLVSFNDFLANPLDGIMPGINKNDDWSQFL